MRTLDPQLVPEPVEERAQAQQRLVHGRTGPFRPAVAPAARRARRASLPLMKDDSSFPVDGSVHGRRRQAVGALPSKSWIVYN